ncbi:Elf1 domain-containing protein [Rhizoctonia solani AG-1 IA]|uniref:Transcription elongation factor 1 homolog n=1 Tax=Thanatephorus cucumeris (strain AG1-IA) TaxID=983506 RepID=L8X8K5_THACA|nr:Elf1 domain-containing protein [Rhizoctonia solani AG-1 IA]
MGKRKSSKKPQSRINVTCKIDKKEGLGYLSCKICAQQYQYLSEPIDVYSSWIDACDEAQASTRPAVSSRRLAAIESDED